MAAQPPNDLLGYFMPIYQQIFPFLFDASHGPGLRLTSWWRSIRVNAAQPDSAKNSQHLIGLAWDLAGPPSTLRNVAAAARAAGLWVKDDYRPPDHIHVQLFDVSRPGYLQLVARLVKALAR